jgi:hypothetical protein
MANAEAWAEGARIGSELAQERRAHKQALSDQQFQDKHDEIQGMIENLGTKLAAVPEDARNTPDYLKMQDQLAQAIQSRDAHWKSVDQPNALTKFGKMLGKDLRFRKQETPTPIAPPVYGQPTIQTPASSGESVTLSAQSAQPASDRVDVVDGHLKATRDPGSPALSASTVSLGGSEAGPAIPTGPAYKVQGPQTPAQMRAAAEASQLVAAAPLSPEQQATTTANAGAAGNLASIQAALKNFDTLNPDATQEERNSFRNTLIQRGLLGQEKPTLKLYTLPDGTKAWLDATRPDLIPPGSTAAVTEPEGTRKRADYEEFKKKNPTYNGSFEEWTALEAAKGRAQAPKPETFDTQYKAILVKEASGQPLTADEQAHKAAWQIYNKETKIDPGVARAAAFGAMRYIPIIDLNNPEKVVMMRAGDAAKAGASTPQSIGFKTDAAITRYMTSGQGATNINYFNTATGHLELLRQAGEALNNGDYPAFNSFANRFATATGDPAPTNFDTVKSAVAGELSKTFKGTGATDQEIAEISTTLNNAQSPQQIVGAITYYTKLMGEKLDALKGQYEAGKTGKPNFPTPPPGLGDGTTPQGGGNATPKPKKRISIKMAMMLPENKGKTEAEVTKHLTDSGYTPVKP